VTHLPITTVQVLVNSFSILAILGGLFSQEQTSHWHPL